MKRREFMKKLAAVAAGCSIIPKGKEMPEEQGVTCSGGVYTSTGDLSTITLKDIVDVETGEVRDVVVLATARRQ